MSRLTDNQKEMLRWLVREVRAGLLPEEFTVIWFHGDADERWAINEWTGTSRKDNPKITEGALNALTAAGLLIFSGHKNHGSCTLTGRAYEAVDNDFKDPSLISAADPEERAHVKRQLADYRKTLRMVEEKIPQYGAEVHLPILDRNLLGAIRAKIAELEQHLAILDGNAPDPASETQPNRLRVGFQHGKTFVEHLTIVCKPLPVEPDYDTVLAQERDRILRNHRQQSQKTTNLASQLFGSVINEQALNDYLEKYRSYLQDLYMYGVCHDRLYEISPNLRATARQALDNVTLMLILPPGVRWPTRQEHLWLWKDEGEYITAPRPPSEPNLQQTFLTAGLAAQLAQMSGGLNLTAPPMLALDPRPSNDILPSYEIHEGRMSIQYDIPRVLPGRSVKDLVPFWIWLGDFRKSCDLVIDVAVYMAGPIDLETKTVTLSLQVEDQ